MPTQRADHLEREGGLPFLRACQMRVGELVLRQDRIGVHEQFCQHHRQHGAGRNADHLVTELHHAIGSQPPARRAILLHVTAFTRGDGQNRGAKQAHPRIMQPQRSHNEHGHHKRARYRVKVRDAQRDAIDQHEQQTEPHPQREELNRLVQQQVSAYHGRGAPEHDPEQQAPEIDPLPILGRALWLGALLSQPPNGLSQNERQVKDDCAQDGAQRYDEADLAVWIPRLEPADADQVRCLPPADQRHHQRRDRDARPDDQAAAERGRR